MIKIRYATLPEGLHAQARWQNRHTILYLRHGLTSQQRREVLRRARQSARMGHGPRLPAAGMALALATDRIAATTRNVIAAVRCHPLGSGVLAALIAGGVVSYSLFVTVTVRLVYPQVDTLRPNVPHPAVALPAPARSAGARHQPGATGQPGTSRATSSAAPVVRSQQPSAVPTPGRTPATGQPSPAPTPTTAPSAAGACITVAGLQVCVKV